MYKRGNYKNIKLSLHNIIYKIQKGQISTAI